MDTGSPISGVIPSLDGATEDGNPDEAPCSQN